MKQLFFSHTWKNDKLNRNNHLRVKKLSELMGKLGWTIWLDENEMIGNIDACMANGIDNSICVILCITEEYCNKINNSARDPRNSDNCLKEWDYTHNRNKLTIPIIMEPHMLNASKWSNGVVSMYLGAILYLDASNDKNITSCANLLHTMLLKYGLKPRIRYLKKCRRILSSSSNSLKRSFSSKKINTIIRI